MHAKKIIGSKYFKAITFSSLAIACLVIGLLISSSINWTRPSVAQTLTPTPQVALTSPTTRPTNLAVLAKKLSPSVVNIRVIKMEKAAFESPGMQFPDGQFGDLFKKFFKEMPQTQKKYRAQGAGSGVIISKDGYILTNNHVVEGAKEVTVTLANQKEYRAKVVGCDPKTDLAILKIKSSHSFPAVAMGNSDQLQVGDWVLKAPAVDLPNTLTMG